MTPARPTTLRLFAECCPHALDLYEQNGPRDRSIFAVGTAAHDVLHQVGIHGRDAVEATVHALMSKGRGGVDAEPPLPPNPVLAGRDLALRYINRFGLPERDRAWFELGLGFDAGWQAAGYREAKWFRTRLDVVELVEHSDEESYGRGLVVRDYKSAWTAGDALLDSIQMRAQAVAVWKSWDRFGDEEPDFIRREIVNLRTMQVSSDEVWIADGGDEVLETWRRDLELVIAAAAERPRLARPGIQCVGCDYALECRHAAALAAAQGLASLDERQVVEAYAVAEARAQGLESLARAAADGGAIETEHGAVGWVEREVNEPTDDAAIRLWEQWTIGKDLDDGTNGLVRGFLTEIRFGVGQIHAAARLLHPGRKQKAERESLAEELLRPVVRRKFGIHAKPKTVDATPLSRPDDLEIP